MLFRWYDYWCVVSLADPAMAMDFMRHFIQISFSATFSCAGRNSQATLHTFYTILVLLLLFHFPHSTQRMEKYWTRLGNIKDASKKFDLKNEIRYFSKHSKKVHILNTKHGTFCLVQCSVRSVGCSKPYRTSRVRVNVCLCTFRFLATVYICEVVQIEFRDGRKLDFRNGPI